MIESVGASIICLSPYSPDFNSINVSVLLNNTPTVNFGAATYSATEGNTDTIINIPVTIGSSPVKDLIVPIALNPSSTATQTSQKTLSVLLLIPILTAIGIPLAQTLSAPSCLTKALLGLPRLIAGLIPIALISVNPQERVPQIMLAR